MDTSNNKLISNKAFVIILAIASILLSVITMSPDSAPKYEFTEGLPWMYDELIAPFNFSIQKSDEQMQEEIDSLKKAFMPYYALNPDKEAEMVGKFDKYFKDSLQTLVSANTSGELKERLTFLYDSGIIGPDELESLNGSQTEYIRSYSGNSSALLRKELLFTPKTAYGYLMNLTIPETERLALNRSHLEEFIVPNLKYDVSRTEDELKSQEEQISKYAGMVMANQKIIGRGDIVDKTKYQIIDSYMDIVSRQEKAVTFDILTWSGLLLYVTIAFVILSLFLFLYRSDIIDSRATVTFLFSTITIFTVFTNLYMRYSAWSVYLIPTTMLALMLRIFIDSRTAVMGYSTYLLVCSINALVPYDFMFLQLVAGIVAVYSIHELEKRSQLFASVSIILVTYLISWLSIQMIQLDDINNLSWLIPVYLTINCVILLLTYPLLLAIEKIFGFTSNVTLIELSNINNPLLIELAETAQGTFQHSMQVATLAAEAARTIKASTQLARTAALYHDIGKITNPAFFTENQNGVNPHDKLSYEESARIITQHVDDGRRLAIQHHLPESIKNCIVTHHGNGLVKYFYIKYINENPGREADANLFRYTGTNPNTKESAILMMADAVEASSRSLPEYTEDAINNLIDKIIDTQVSEGFFNECPITFKEIAQVKTTFKEKLKTMYHTRISYPTLDKKEQ